MVQMGTYEELLSTSASFARLLEDINQHQHQHQQDQKEHVPILTSPLSRRDTVCTEYEDEAEIESPLSDTEVMQAGTVKWNVFISYLDAGIGVILGASLIVILFSIHQVLLMYSNRWLAEWSNEESHRYRVNNNCTNMFTQKILKIRSMSNAEWDKHRDDRFRWYSSKSSYSFSTELLLIHMKLFSTGVADRCVYHPPYSDLAADLFECCPSTSQ